MWRTKRVLFKLNFPLAAPQTDVEELNEAPDFLLQRRRAHTTVTISSTILDDRSAPVVQWVASKLGSWNAVIPTLAKIAPWKQSKMC